jgi:hypothetical protein
MSDDVFHRFLEQHKRGERIGADIATFHLSGGMVTRNILREVILDEELPAVIYPDGSASRNWDDFYTGALEELCERAPLS